MVLANSVAFLTKLMHFLLVQWITIYNVCGTVGFLGTIRWISNSRSLLHTRGIDVWCTVDVYLRFFSHDFLMVSSRNHCWSKLVCLPIRHTVSFLQFDTSVHLIGYIDKDSCRIPMMCGNTLSPAARYRYNGCAGARTSSSPVISDACHPV